MTDFLPVENHPKHDRRTNQCRDRVDGQVAFEGGQTCDEVAEQGQVHAEKGRGRDEQLVVAAAEQESGDVWHGQAQEGNGTTKRRDEGGEEARSQDDEHTAATDVDAEVLGITLAKEQEVQGLEEQERAYGANRHRDGEEGQLGLAHIGEATQAPDDEGVQAFLLAEELQDVGDRAGDVGDHDTHQHQADHAAEPRTKGEDEQQHREGAQEGRYGDAEGRPQRQRADRQARGGAQQDHEGHAETRTAADAQQGRVGVGVAEEGLHQEARHR